MDFDYGLCVVLFVEETVMALDVAINAVVLPKIRIRKHDREIIEKMKQSITELGLQQPIYVTRTSQHRFKLIDGLLRLTACRELGHTTIMAFMRD